MPASLLTATFLAAIVAHAHHGLVYVLDAGGPGNITRRDVLAVSEEGVPRDTPGGSTDDGPPRT